MTLDSYAIDRERTSFYCYCYDSRIINIIKMTDKLLDAIILCVTFWWRLTFGESVYLNSPFLLVTLCGYSSRHVTETGSPYLESDRLRCSGQRVDWPLENNHRTLLNGITCDMLTYKALGRYNGVQYYHVQL